MALMTPPYRAAQAQEEVTSKIYRYRERVATGYYEGYEVSPWGQYAKIDLPEVSRGLFPFGLSAANVRIRTRLPDAHWGLKFYGRSTCIECHPGQARDLHSTRAGISCRQCHGPEPIPSNNHYYSAMNPIRRHAYVCAKCHEGANASFADFYVHEPPSGSLETKESFPLLFYAHWAMLVLLVGTLAFFIPHSLMVGLRELVMIKGFAGLVSTAFILPGRFFRWLGGFLIKKGKNASDRVIFFVRYGLKIGIRGEDAKEEKEENKVDDAA